MITLNWQNENWRDKPNLGLESYVVWKYEILNVQTYFGFFRLDEVEDAVNINNKLSQTVKNKDEKISSFETR